MYSMNSPFQQAQDIQDIAYVLLFFSILMFVFMIYVGICIIIIKNDVKKLTGLELKKDKEKKETAENNTKTEEIINKEN